MRTPAIAAEHARPLSPEESFLFSCHPGLACFTECCRELDLVLSPYDVLRMRRNLGLKSSAFLDRYVLVEFPDDGGFPLVYLAMLDDGRASCPFISRDGCLVYADRPGACRTYPLGRGAFLSPGGDREEFHILLREPHCQGFSEPEIQSVRAWVTSQDLFTYQAINDELLFIHQQSGIKGGMPLSDREREIYLLLYDLDTLDQKVLAGDGDLPFLLTEKERRALAGDDLALLRLGIRWLTHVLATR